MTDPSHGRPEGAPRLPPGRAPIVPKEGTISSKPEEMPDTLAYDAGKQRLLVGGGFVDNVLRAAWEYEVSSKQVLVQWFSYRRKHRERPIIGDRRQPSPLGNIQPDHWLPEYTTELLNVLNVLAMLVELEPKQAASAPTDAFDGQMSTVGAEPRGKRAEAAGLKPGATVVIPTTVIRLK